MFHLFICSLFLRLQLVGPSPIAVQLKATSDIYKKHDFNQVRSTLDSLSLRISQARVEATGTPYEPKNISNDAAHTNGLFEGDIVLSPSQLRSVVEAAADEITANSNQTVDSIQEIDNIVGISNSNETNRDESSDAGLNRTKRKILRDPDEKWSTNKPIPYGFDTYFFEESLVRRAIKVWESNTCLKFEEIDDVMSEDNFDDRIVFFAGDGCYSSVGRGGGLQGISIGFGCDLQGIVEHEIAHALGLWHEQSRPDRDAFVEINWDNIYEHTKVNFLKQHKSVAATHGVPYDYGSVMHYAPKDFAIWGETAIVTKDPKYMGTIGQRDRLTFFDIKVVNIAYCSNVCREYLACHNDGYQDPRNCTQCKCPEGFTGQYCDQLETSTMPNCTTQTLTAKTTAQTLAYSSIQKGRCIWKLKSSSAGRPLHVKVTRMDLPCNEPCYSFLEIKRGDDKNGGFGGTGPRHCCQDFPRETQSTNSSALIILESDRTARFYRGFRLEFWEESPDEKEGESNDGNPETDQIEVSCWSKWSDWSGCLGVARVRYRKCMCDCSKIIGDSLQLTGCGGNNQPITPTATQPPAPCSRTFTADCDLIRTGRITDYFPEYELTKSVRKPGLVVKMSNSAFCTINVPGTCDGKTFKPAGTPRLDYTQEAEIQLN